MAQEESARAISTHTEGGSPYLEAYAGGDAIKYREGMFNEAMKAAQEDRDKKTFDLTNLKEARLQKQQEIELESRLKSEARQAKLDDLKFKSDQRREDMELQKAIDSDRKESGYTKIAGLNPKSLGFREDISNAMKDPDVVYALGKTGGSSLLSIKQQLMKEHQNYADGIQWSLRNAGLPDNPYNTNTVKRDPETGEHIWNKEFDDTLQQGYVNLAAKQKAQDEEKVKQGYIKQRITESDGKERDVWIMPKPEPEVPAGMAPTSVRRDGVTYSVPKQSIAQTMLDVNKSIEGSKQGAKPHQPSISAADLSATPLPQQPQQATIQPTTQPTTSSPVMVFDLETGTLKAKE